jgi:hypothetical protein
MTPDIEETLPPHIATGDGELNAGEDLAIGCDVAMVVARAARNLV